MALPMAPARVEPRTSRPNFNKCEDSLTHITCCLDYDVSMCGLDMTDVPIAQVFDKVCVVCMGLAKDHACPLGKKCPPHDLPGEELSGG